jgi:hypothetical protein
LYSAGEGNRREDLVEAEGMAETGVALGCAVLSYKGDWMYKWDLTLGISKIQSSALYLS